MLAEFIITLPTPCRCASLAAKVAPAQAPEAGHAADAICIKCNAHRMKVSQETFSTLSKVAQMFGAPREPIVFRASKRLLEKIRQHDLYLQTHYGPDGRSWYQIITDVHNSSIGDDVEPPTDDSGIEVVD